LDYSNVDHARPLAFPSPKLPDVADWQCQKGRQSLALLIHQLTPVDKNQRADASTCNKACSNYRLSEGGWSAQYALVVSKQLSDGVVLFSSQFSTKRNINVLSCGSFILNLDPDSVPLEQADHLF
jgi:hypothetical protein